MLNNFNEIMYNLSNILVFIIIQIILKLHHIKHHGHNQSTTDYGASSSKC